MNLSINGRVSFTCSVCDAVDILWRVNDASIDKIPGLDDDHDYQISANVLTLTVNIEIHQGLNTDYLNNSIITCSGYCFQENGNVLFSEQSTPARLLLQG